MRKWLALCLMALTLAGCAAISAEGADAPELMTPVGVKVDSTLVRVGEIAQIDCYGGGVVTEREELFFTVDGRVLEIHARLGDTVHKGDLLMTLDESDLVEQEAALVDRLAYEREDAEFERRRSELEIQKLEVEARRAQDALAGAEDAQRQIELMREEVEAERLAFEQQMEVRALSLEKLEAELAAVRAKIGHNEIVSPVDGHVVYMRPLDRGDYIAAYDTMYCLADDSTMKLDTEYISDMYFSAANRYYALVNGRSYDIELVPADWQENITISLAGGELRSQFLILNPDENIEVGMYASVCLVSKYLPDALVVPRNAYYTDSAGRYVYKLVDGVRVRQTVKVGYMTDTLVQITEGLQEGDEVYVKE